jgi:hypothetical protein
VVHAYHREYAELEWRRIAPLLVDARNAMEREPVEAQGVRYVGIGRPATAD